MVEGEAVPKHPGTFVLLSLVNPPAVTFTSEEEGNKDGNERS